MCDTQIAAIQVLAETRRPPGAQLSPGTPDKGHGV